MIRDTETNEEITGPADELYEMMARHLAKRINACNPPDTESAALAGVRAGIAFMASMFDQALTTGKPGLASGVLSRALVQRDAWGLKEATEVQFVNMSHMVNNAKH